MFSNLSMVSDGFSNSDPILPVAIISACGILLCRYLRRVAQCYVVLVEDRHMLANAATLRMAFWLPLAGRKTQHFLHSWSQTDIRSGRLRSCVYCLVLTGFWLFLYIDGGADSRFFALMLASSGMLLLALIDAKCGLLPDALTLPLLVFGLFTALAGKGLTSLESAVIGAGAMYAGLSLSGAAYRWIRKRDGLGRGDVKLCATLGAWLGWPDVFHALFLASIVGLITALLSPRKTGSDEYPFGPSLILGAGIIVMGRVTDILT